MSEVIGVCFSYIFFLVDLRLKLLIHPFPCKTENEGSNPSPVTTFPVLGGYANSLCVYDWLKRAEVIDTASVHKLSYDSTDK